MEMAHISRMNITTHSFQGTSQYSMVLFRKPVYSINRSYHCLYKLCIQVGNIFTGSQEVSQILPFKK